MSTVLIPDNWRVFLGEDILSTFTAASNNAYYLFVSEHVTLLDTVLPDALDDPQQIYVNVYHDMIEGKRLTRDDATLVIRNIPYTVGDFYNMYDDGDPLLATKDYYAITNNGSFYHVWKVLDNNNGANSTIPPDFSNIDVNDEIYQTSDGYRWKYMYSVDSTTAYKFGTPSYFPLIANAAVAEAALNGAIDVIQVQTPGQGYDNYLTGVFSTGDIQINGNTLIYSISSNSAVQTTNGFYTGCMLYMSAGAGIGQFKMVTNYFTNGNGNFMVLDSEFVITPQNGDQYEVYPSVFIQGDGRQAVNAVARALVNAVGNSIYRVEMMSRGEDYRYATANVVANAVVGVISPAAIRPVYSPPGGHGSDAAIELRATGICFAMHLANNENNTIPATNQFQQYGIIRDPTFSNVKIGLVSATPNPFIPGETAVKIDTVLIKSNATTNSISAEIDVGINGRMNERVSVGDWLYLSGPSTTTNKMLAQVNSVINGSAITLTTNCFFTDSAVDIFRANLEGNAIVSSVPGATAVFVSNISSQWQTGDTIIGLTSGGYGVINTTSVNDIFTDLNTFVAMYKFTGAYVSGTFNQNEKVYEGANLASSSANASIHSAMSNGSTTVIYISNVVGVFETTLTGADSGAVFSIAESYNPDIDFGSGKVIYLENITAVPRAVSTTENFNLVFLF
jgi:hypothetical protein